MRCVLLCALIFTSTLGQAAAETPTFSEPFTVVIDHAKVLRLPDRTQTVIVGNPAIADVAVQKSGILVLTGKSFGRTNLIALDGAGALLAESFVSVQAPDDAIVTVQRGLDREVLLLHSPLSALDAPWRHCEVLRSRGRADGSAQ